MIMHLTSDEGKDDLKSLGGVSSTTAGVILRALTNLEAEGGDTFFGEPKLEPPDLLASTTRAAASSPCSSQRQAAAPGDVLHLPDVAAGRAVRGLPEVGDLDKPKLVFLFDEAHLLFTDASKAFLEQAEQTVKLIRSKGVGVFFCTQLPTDVPGPCSPNSVPGSSTHCGRSPRTIRRRSAKTVKTYPITEDYELYSALTSLGIGEAIVTVLSERGAPTPVAWTRVRVPRSLMAADRHRRDRRGAKASPLQADYGQTIDRESAYEMLKAKYAAGPRDSAGHIRAAADARPGRLPTVSSFDRWTAADAPLGRAQGARPCWSRCCTIPTVRIVLEHRRYARSPTKHLRPPAAAGGSVGYQPPSFL